VDPACRTVYVDSDTIVLIHARALLASDHRTIAVDGDARDPDGIFTDPAVRAHLDLDQPVAVPDDEAESVAPALVSSGHLHGLMAELVMSHAPTSCPTRLTD
jgi:hypothetical protein